MDLMDTLPLDSAGHGLPTGGVPYAAARNAADPGLPDDAAAWAIAFVAGWPDYDTVNVYATNPQRGFTSQAIYVEDFQMFAGWAVIDPNLSAGVPHYPRPSTDLLTFDAELDLLQEDLPGAP